MYFHLSDLTGAGRSHGETAVSKVEAVRNGKFARTVERDAPEFGHGDGGVHHSVVQDGELGGGVAKLDDTL